MSIILELGPGDAFLFDTPGGTTTNNLPEGLKDLEDGVGQGRPIQAIYSLNFGCNGAYILGARTVNGPIIRMHNLPPQLQSWLVDPNTHTCKRDVPTLAVELGPNGSFYARDKDSYRWHNLPDALEEAIQQRLCPAGWTARPDLVVLGADGAFIYSNDGGGHCHALGNYPKLQEHIVGLQRANVGGLTGFALVHWISMSIYRPGHFVAVHNSGNYIAELSPNSFQALTSMAGTFPVRNTTPQQPQQRAVSSPIMQHPSPPIAQYPSPPMAQQASPPLTMPSSPPAMTHGAMPIRKPVYQPMASPPMQPQPPPRPQPNHLVSSPIPQAYPARPAVHHQTSAPTPHVQPPTSPMSTQVPPTQAPKTSTKHKLSSANFKAAGQLASIFHKASGGSNFSYNNNSSSSSNSYSNTSNANNNTYVVGGDSGTAPAPTYVMPGDSGTAPAYGVPGDSGTGPVYTAAGDSGIVPPAGDSGSFVPAGDSGIASTILNSTAASTGGDSGSVGGFLSGLFSGGGG